MKHLDPYQVKIIGKKDLTSNIVQYNVNNITDDLIDQFKNKFKDKWILTFDNDYIFVKDRPVKYDGKLPKKVYHVSPIDNLDKIGILPSSKTESPFGYYNISFFYLSIEDSEGGSIPYMDGMYLYEIDTKSTNNWTNGFNEELDEEENITTSDIINPEFIKKIK